MLEISYGERGPRVVLLQILLNRRGNTLVADGIFGPKTKAAVVAFQRTLPGGVIPMGKVEPSTFNPLFNGSGLAIIDVVDVGDPMLAQREAQQLRAAGSAPIELGLMCNGVGQMISDVLRRAQSPIALLRITGHGNLGRWMTISVGSVAHLPAAEYRVIAAEYYSYIDPTHFSELKTLLSQLTPHFASFGSMEHLGCSIGGRAESRTLMQGLSTLWRVPVSAGIRTQLSVLHFDGPVHTEYPRRSNLATWSTQFRNQSL